MTGDAHIIVDSSENAASLVYDEIFFDEEDKPYIWVVKNNRLLKKYIDIGLEGDLYTQITSEIEEEVVVPISDDAEIEEGYKVKIVQ